VSAHAHCISFRVRYSETDQMGVVYHPNYLVWCEIGRTELMRACGAAYAELERDGLLLAVAEASIRYAAAARYDDEIRVTTEVRRVQSRSVTFGYRIDRIAPAPGLCVATAETRLLAVGRDFVPRMLPRPLLDRFRALITESAADARPG
jgi:acyl-CoA thioester hydrolase